MNDSRVTLWTNPTTISTNTTTNGPTLDVFGSVGVAGSHITGTGIESDGYGVRVQLVPTGTAFNLTVKVQESPDDSNWYDLKTLYVGDPVSDLVGSKITIESMVAPSRRYIRLAIVSTNISAESCVVNAWITDVGHDVGITVRYA